MIICAGGMDALTQYLPRDKIQALTDTTSAVCQYVDESTRTIARLEKEIQYWQHHSNTSMSTRLPKPATSSHSETIIPELQQKTLDMLNQQQQDMKNIYSDIIALMSGDTKEGLPQFHTKLEHLDPLLQELKQLIYAMQLDSKQSYSISTTEKQKGNSAIRATTSTPPIESLRVNVMNFQENDTMLFLPCRSSCMVSYQAVNVECPHYFLSKDSKALIGQTPHFRKEYVLGKVVLIEKMEVPASCSKSKANHNMKTNQFQLPVGTTYYVVSVANVTS